MHFLDSGGDDLRSESFQFRQVSGNEHDNDQLSFCESEDMYTNVNTFSALIARQDPPQASQLRSCVDYAFTILAFLEHDPGTTYDEDAHFAVRAAAAWLVIAGKQVMATGSPSTNYSYIPGSLWEAERGTNAVDVTRL